MAILSRDTSPSIRKPKILPKMRFRVWIDKNDSQMKKLDVQVIDTVSFGLFLARLHKGSRIVVEQTRVNDEVWLQQHIAVTVDVRLALLKDLSLEVDVSDRDPTRNSAPTRRLFRLGRSKEALEPVSSTFLARNTKTGQRGCKCSGKSALALDPIRPRRTASSVNVPANPPSVSSYSGSCRCVDR